MPIEPPNPHRIVEALRAVEAQLVALAATMPGSVLPKVAIGGVGVALLATEALVGSPDASTTPAA